MKKLEFQDIIPLQEYEKIRESFRQSVIEQKKRRHVQVGPYVSLAFENRETVLFQVQEMIRAERLQDPAKIQEEIDVYNDLIPGARELSATLFIEITEEGKIQEILNRLIGIDKENMVYFQIGKKKRIPAIFEAGRSKEEKISAVHFVRFKWDFTQIETFRSGNENFLVIDHPNYREQTAISEALKKELLEDLDQSDE
ncbi:MAG TPA: DUF3501 family protein [Candidatus Manganitrophaceae bacterium]